MGQELRKLWREVVTWLKKNSKAAAISAALGALLGFLINAAYLTFPNGGYDVQAGAAMPGLVTLSYLSRVPGLSGGIKFLSLHGTLVFGIFTVVVSSAFGYWWQVGTKTFLSDIRGIPKTFGRFLERDKSAALAHMLWGAALSLAASRILYPWLMQALVLGLLVALPSVFGRFFCILLLSAFRTLAAKISPLRHLRLRGPIPVAVAIIGAAAALLVAYLLEGAVSRIALAVVCGLGAVWAQRGPHKKALTTILLAVLAVEMQTEVWAHDGGWAENDYDFWIWLLGRPGTNNTGGGLAVLGVSAVGAATAAVGAPVGAGAGGVAGSTPSGWSGETDYDQEAWDRVDELWREIGDSEIFERLAELEARAAETGRINLQELEQIARDHDDKVLRERQRIDAQHQRFSEENRERQQERLQQEREQEQADARARDQRSRLINKGEALLGRVDDLVRRQQLEDMLHRHADDPDKLQRAVNAIRQQTYEAEQERLAGERERAEMEEQELARGQQTAEGYRDWSLRANRAAARVIPGGHSVVAAQQAAYGAAQGYGEGGVAGAAQRAAAGVVDNYTEGGGTAILETRREGGNLNDLGNRWGGGIQESYDPREFGRRLRGARNLGEIVDVALDAGDATDGFRSSGPESAGQRDSTSPGPARSESGSQSRSGSSSSSGRPGSSRSTSADGSTQRATVAESGQASRGQEPIGRSRDSEASSRRPSADLDQSKQSNQGDRGAQLQAELERTRREEGQAEMAARDPQEAATDAARRSQRADHEGDHEGYVSAQRDLLHEQERATDHDAEQAGKDLENAARAREEAERKLEEYRQQQLANDPRGRAQIANAEYEQASERFREADRRAHAATDPAEQERLMAERREAAQELGEATRNRNDAHAGLQNHRVIEQQATQTVNNHIQQTFGLPASNPGDLRIRGDQRGVRAEYGNVYGRDREVIRVVDPSSGVEVAVNPDKVAYDTATGKEVVTEGPLAGQPVTRATERIPTYPDGNPHGFNVSGTKSGQRPSVSIRSPGTAVHEQVHAHTHDNFQSNSGTPVREGFTEYLTRRVAHERGLTNLPEWNRRGHYDSNTQAVAHIASTIGRDKVEGAYFHGRVEELHTSIGEKLGAKGGAAGAKGTEFMNRLETALGNKDSAEASRLLRQLN